MRNSVLIVDDEQSICSALQRTLRARNFRVLSANSGAEALSLLKNNTVDVIVSDQKMPGMTGTELLSVVKDSHPHIGRIILSGHSDASDLTAAINEANINTFLTKPWDDENLITTVENTINKTAQKSDASPLIASSYKPSEKIAYKPSRAISTLINQTYQVNLEKDIKNDRLLLNKVCFSTKDKHLLPLSTYQALWPAFSNFNHTGIVNIAHQSGFQYELFLWYLISINASINYIQEEDKIIDLFFEPLSQKSLMMQQLLTLLRTHTQLIFRVEFDNISKASFKALLPEIKKNNHSILLSLGSRVIDVTDFSTLPVHHIELDSQYSSLSNPKLTEYRFHMLNDAQNMGIKTILSRPQSKLQYDYGVSMGFDYF